MITLMGFSIMSLIAVIAYWKDERHPLLIAGFTMLIFGGYYVATTGYAGLALILFGVYTAARGLGYRS
jgi:hypothetical protein